MLKPVEVSVLQRNKESGFNYRKRRHPQWTENYTLYRDTVITNRLLNRQSVNVPLMKETIKTMLSRIDDAPDLNFENQDNDKQKELFFNAYWEFVSQDNKLEIQDIIDKKQVMLYGRSFMKLNVTGGRFTIEVIDPQDVIVDRYVDPHDIETAHHLTHTGIFRTLNSLEQNSNYDKDALRRLRTFYATAQGLVKAEQNAQLVQDRNQRLEEMGLADLANPILGETYIELNEHFVKVWDGKEFKIVVITMADNEKLMEKPLEDILGVNFFPFTTWADDIEKTDFWSDGVADIVRVPNQVANTWLSQLVENRTMRNYGMQFYDATAKEGWQPMGYEPAPFGFYPLPGKPGEVLQRVEIPDLSESLDELQFVIGLAEKATAATSIEKGESPDNRITLGEVQLLASKANERITSMSKFYLQARKDMGEKFAKMALANTDALSAVKLYKKSAAGNYYDRNVKPTDWRSKSGYITRITSKAQKEKDTMELMQKFQVAKQEFPMNPALQRIQKKKVLDWIGLTPEETKEVMDADEQMKMQPPMPMPGQMPTLPMPSNKPMQLPNVG